MQEINQLILHIDVQQVAELQKENFGLKLRIYFLENRMKTPFGDNEENINEMVRVVVVKRYSNMD